MSSIFPNRELTEAALKLIHWAEDDFRLSMVSPPSVGRVIRTSLGPIDPNVIRQHATLFRMVSVVESYLDALSRELLHDGVPYNSPALELLFEDFDSGTTATWARRKETYLRYHRFSLEKRAEWPKVNAAIDARNSVAHGLGRLTPTQAPKRRAIENRLRTIEVSIVDRELRFGNETIQLTRKACLEFIRSVDEQVPLLPKA